MAETLTITYRALTSLKPYERNARTHSPEQVAQIARSIQEFGWTNPILVDEDGGVIAGHGRLAAAVEIGMDRVPTICLAGLSEAQRRALGIADNKLALNAGWDLDVLGSEIEALALSDFDLSLLGFSETELQAMTAAEFAGNTDPDDVPPTPEEPVSKPGDVWVMGRHRIVCGDCTVQVDVDKALAGVKPHLMVTDPPYGVEYDPAWRDRVAPKRNGSKRADGKVLNDDRDDWSAAWALFPGDVAYVWHGYLQVGTMQEQLVRCGFETRAHIIWAKSRLVLGRGHYHAQHESAWYAVRRSGTGHWAGDRKQTTLWQIDTNRSNDTGHGTQKPVECMKRPIENNSSPGQAVYEPFSGSGTTIIASEMTGRCCHAIELNPAYVDVAVKRWQDLTGQQAVLEGDGRTFDEIARVKAAEPEAA